ncbi:dihydrolipoamide dehydrogenase [Candidatus Uzinura diaspidicola str. ASNER]|uniref:Dihydrolipoyl dehydrogenase n=1 Tax=Candidatus Uzinura diaspidicola str. ASNER TaxID=1133592 RepID=L7VFW0_9FLAO|nr:dihydrolipoamide dehydrogenase [Candidatus Uzinura diaspidicola str. ASNER]
MDFDLVIIGSGPGGYVAAIRAAQLGFKTAIIEKEKLGGICLNWGCIPTKALLESSYYYYKLDKKFSKHGIFVSDVILDFYQMIHRKNKIIHSISKEIKYLLNRNKVDIFQGLATFKNSNTLYLFTLEKEKLQSVIFNNAIIATGSKAVDSPIFRIDKQRIISSTEALSLKEIPNHLIIIGGGVTGVEIASVYCRLGSKISLIEFCDQILSSMDIYVCKEIHKILYLLGIDFYLSSTVKSVKVNIKEVVVCIKNNLSEVNTLIGDYVLVAIGRMPYTKDLGLENIGVFLKTNDFIPVNEKLQTVSNNIYAIGDVIGGQMLAHKSEKEGLFVVEHIAGHKPYINYSLIPSVVYTGPEVASVGKNQEQLRDEGRSYNIGKFPMRSLGRSRVSGDLDGFVIILSDKNTDEILGCHIISSRASDMIMEVAVAMEFGATSEEIAHISHPHPTFSEAIREASNKIYTLSPITRKVI